MSIIVFVCGRTMTSYVTLLILAVTAAAASPAIRFAPNPFANKEPPPDFTTVRKLLREELRASHLYNEIWKNAESEFQRKKRILPKDYFKSTTPDQCYIAIIAYTLNDKVFVEGESRQLFQDFNEQFRKLTDEASWAKFPYKSLFYLMTLALPGVKNKPEIDRPLYRGMKNVHISPEPRIGEIFYFDSFTSCTSDRPTAKEFLGDNGTMIIIRNGARVACGVDAYSYYDEDEVLVFPKNKFRIVRFKKNGKKRKLILENVGSV